MKEVKSKCFKSAVGHFFFFFLPQMLKRRTSALLPITLQLPHQNKTTMTTISINYRLKWRLIFDHKYQWSECGKLFNVSRGKIKKKVVNGSSIGYWIGRNFYTLDNLRSQLELIPKQKLPF